MPSSGRSARSAPHRTTHDPGSPRRARAPVDAPSPSSPSSTSASFRADLGTLVEAAASRMSSSPARIAAAAAKRSPPAADACRVAAADLSLLEKKQAVAVFDDSADGKNNLGIMNAELKKLICSAVAEMLGLGLICFFGCMGTLSGPLGSALPHIQVAFTFGLVVMVAIACFGHISGAHFNPAVTVMALILKMIDIKTSVVYVIAQVIGGILGYGLLKVVTPTSLLYWGRKAAENVTVAGPCCTTPHAELSPVQAVLGELLGTAALLMLCCSVWDPRNAHNSDGNPIKFGLLIAAIAMCLGPYTGASLNPARSLGPAIWEGTWTLHWVYWVGPLSAAVLLGYGWPLLFSPVPEPIVRDHADVPLTLVSGDGKRHSRLADDDNGDVKGGY